jgi:hypothetical protein
MEVVVVVWKKVDSKSSLTTTNRKMRGSLVVVVVAQLDHIELVPTQTIVVVAHVVGITIRLVEVRSCVAPTSKRPR